MLSQQAGIVLISLYIHISPIEKSHLSFILYIVDTKLDSLKSITLVIEFVIYRREAWKKF